MHPTWALVFILLTIQPHAALSNSTLTFGAAGTDVPIAGHPLLAPRATKGRPPPHASRPPATGDGQLDPPYLRPSVVGRAQPHSARKLHQALGSILSAFQLSLLEHVLQTTPPDDDPERAERVVRSLVRAAAHAPPVPALRLVSSLGLLRALDEALHDEARRRRFELLPVLWVLAEVARKQNEAYVNAHEMPVRRQLCLFKLRRSRSCAWTRDGRSCRVARRPVPGFWWLTGYTVTRYHLPTSRQLSAAVRSRRSSRVCFQSGLYSCAFFPSSCPGESCLMCAAVGKRPGCYLVPGVRQASVPQRVRAVLQGARRARDPACPRAYAGLGPGTLAHPAACAPAAARPRRARGSRRRRR